MYGIYFHESTVYIRISVMFFSVFSPFFRFGKLQNPQEEFCVCPGRTRSGASLRAAPSLWRSVLLLARSYFIYTSFFQRRGLPAISRHSVVQSVDHIIPSASLNYLTACAGKPSGPPETELFVCKPTSTLTCLPVTSSSILPYTERGMQVRKP